MKRVLLGTIALLALGTAPALPQQKTIKIGFISSFSGPAAAIGNDMRNSFELALDHHGRKLGGLPVEVIYEDDQIKPEVGVQKTQKLIESDRVDFLVGYIWSNVLLASLKQANDSKTFLITTNAGPSQIAGELCSPYVFSTSWQNDQTPQAMGTYMNQKGVKSVFLIGPNYAAGKDMLAGVKIQSVPYKGSGPVSADVLGGQVQLGVVDVPSAIANVKAGKIRALAVTTKRRITAAPDVPTFEEAGLPGYEAIGWFGAVAPAGTPKEIVNRLNSEIRAALTTPEVRERALSAGAEPFPTSPEEFAAIVRDETKKWGEVVRTAGIKLQ